jgi:cbb3-type cytochrome oxidase subunit 3
MKLYKRSKYYIVVAEAIFELGVVMFTGAFIGFFFFRDEKVTDEILIKMLLLGIIFFMYGSLKKQRKEK